MIFGGFGGRSFGLALLLVAAAESAALACSCLAPGTPQETHRRAREALRNAVAIVEADVLSEYRGGSEGERVRVVRTLWGEAPEEFRVARGEFASSAACDMLLAQGERRLLILYDPEDILEVSRSESYRARPGEFSIQSICSDYLVRDGYLNVTLQEARRLRRGAGRPGGERG